MTTFVSVGNAPQPFKRLLEAVCALAPSLPREVVVQYGVTEFACTECTGIPFLPMERFVELVDKADLLILHAGAGSVIHAVYSGKRPIVMPRRAKYGEHVDDHQLEFAREMARLDRVVLAEEPDDLAGAVAKALASRRTQQKQIEPKLVSLVRDALSRCERREIGKRPRN